MNGKNMAEKLGLSPEVRELKLGPTFSNSREASAFHTLRYDFKPASVDKNKRASVDVGSNQQVTVTVPHLDGSGTMHTVFKGSHRPYQRECVLIIDKNTGEITLEKLTNNIQLKKTREPSKASSHGVGSSHSAVRPSTPIEKKASPPQQKSLKPLKGLGMPLPKHSPLPASPSYTSKSPSVYKSPPQMSSSLSLSPITSGSLPMIGLEDPLDNAFPSPNLSDNLRQSPYYNQAQDQDEEQAASRVGVLSASSSSNSSSDNDSSDSDSDSPANSVPKSRLTNGHVNGMTQAADVLHADLELSESGSDYDI